MTDHTTDYLLHMRDHLIACDRRWHQLHSPITLPPLPEETIPGVGGGPAE